MTDARTVTTPAADTPAATKKPLTVIEGMDSRRMFDTVELAENYLNDAATRFADYEKIPAVYRGIVQDEDGNGGFDPAVYTPEMRVMVAVLANRGEKGKPSTAKAIVVTPAPKLDTLLATEAGRGWVAKIVDKELNHVAVRLLRTADDLDSVADQMPLTVADYISGRESVGGIMETFNTLFKGLIAAVAEKSPQWAKARLTKNELKKAMESKAYALQYYSKLEDRGDKPSLFVMAMGLGKKAAGEKGLDPAIFDKWLAERDEKPMSTKQDDEDSDDFDLDDLAFKEDAPEAAATPATDSTATAPVTE